jgi:hypothetical protein
VKFYFYKRKNNCFFFVILAKIHCVADSDCINTPNDVACLPFSIIPHHTEKRIREAVRGRDQQFIDDMVHFGMVRL